MGGCVHSNIIKSYEARASHFIQLSLQFLPCCKTVSTWRMAEPGLAEAARLAAHPEAAVVAVGVPWPTMAAPCHLPERPSSCKTCRRGGNRFSTAKQMRICRPSPCRGTRLSLQKGKPLLSPFYKSVQLNVDIVSGSFILWKQRRRTQRSFSVPVTDTRLNRFYSTLVINEFKRRKMTITNSSPSRLHRH